MSFAADFGSPNYRLGGPPVLVKYENAKLARNPHSGELAGRSDSAVKEISSAAAYVE